MPEPQGPVLGLLSMYSLTSSCIQVCVYAWHLVIFMGYDHDDPEPEKEINEWTPTCEIGFKATW